MLDPTTLRPCTGRLLAPLLSYLPLSSLIGLGPSTSLDRSVRAREPSCTSFVRMDFEAGPSATSSSGSIASFPVELRALTRGWEYVRNPSTSLSMLRKPLHAEGLRALRVCAHPAHMRAHSGARPNTRRTTRDYLRLEARTCRMCIHFAPQLQPAERYIQAARSWRILMARCMKPRAISRRVCDGCGLLQATAAEAAWPSLTKRRLGHASL